MMKITTQTLRVSGITFFLLELVRRGNVANLDNAQQFNHLCKLMRLPEADITLDVAADSADSLYQEILQLNMSVADDHWKNQMAIAQKGKRAPDIAKNFSLQEKEVDRTWTTHWDKWVDTYAAIKDDSKTPQEIKQASLKSHSAHQKAAAEIAIRQLVHKAAIYKSELDKLKATTEKVTAEQAKKRITAAVYGGDCTAAEYETAIAWISYTQTRSNDCTGTQASTAAVTLLCICAKDNNGDNSEHFIRTQRATSTWATGSTPDLTTAFNKILGHLPKINRLKLTVDILEQIAADIRTNIKIVSDTGYFGAFTTTDCSGRSSAGLCVKYSGYTADPTTHNKKLPWLDDIEALAAELCEQAQATTDFNRLHETLKTTRQSAFAIPTIMAGYKPPASAEAEKHILTETSNKQVQTEKECNKIDKDTDCAATPKCKWDTKEKDEKKGAS
uniref:Variant surface glycoprotein 1125.4853 n=1 Tax=Trypanosoma brucei TaxID=5691 RepID=A0A1J0RB82_9TRYP|nr:variant surface glycoprotein 1125.4853 [Trypanosoma brucei]